MASLAPAGHFVQTSRSLSNSGFNVISALSQHDILDIDTKHIWHPYSSFQQQTPTYVVESAQGTRIRLKSGEELIDGMSSWWSTLHGYNHPALNEALEAQSKKVSHIMFGGFTHEPAAKLGKQLVELSPDPMQHVFFSDSGSVAVEVAMKMAIQYWQSKGQERTKFLSLKKGYHGDTFAAMSVSDPSTGMHNIFSDMLQKQVFAEAPQCGFHDAWQEHYFDDFKKQFIDHKDTLAAVILEPIVQGTGGMRFYSPTFLAKVRSLTEDHGVLLIADEIATGFGRTGELFACNHADISPDIMCLGKTLSAGYITLAATLCTKHVANTICRGDAGVLMHGPTFMANPLACAVASRSLDLLIENDWQTQIQNLNQWLKHALEPLRNHHAVNDVRTLGGIGVVEMKDAVDLNVLQPAFVKEGIWLRPFGKLIYTMPPYISSEDDIKRIGTGILNTVSKTYKIA